MSKLTSDSEHLYMQVYHYYQKRILDGSFPPGMKMPSLRRCAQELELSRTTVESAYLQLAADGYIISRPQSGYYVTEIAQRPVSAPSRASAPQIPVRFDFASSGVDRESFRFDLWRRYLKSALRQDERLLTYGEPQGERDFRETLAEYVKKQRNILCEPEDIVVGAGVQSLLHILCPLLRTKKTVSFPTRSFLQGISVFQDYGFEVFYRNKNCDLIYVTPAHMTKWGEIMPVSRRLELIHHAQRQGSLILEDDFENEFVYLQKPTPSLHSLDGGRHVVYIGSFSRLLLPSIRISFMILPRPLSRAYQKVAFHYNQTASKAEQIALTQFIRDGHLASQTRRLRRLYSAKLKGLLEAVTDTFGTEVPLQIGSAGTSIALSLPKKEDPQGSPSDFPAFAGEHGIRIEALSQDSDFITLLLSCSAMPLEDFPSACRTLKEVWELYV